MSNEIIQLTCISCGGPLPINTNQAVVTCPYCANTYFVSDILDQIVFCPLCRQSNKVEKVTTISKNHALYRVLRLDLDDFPLPDYEYESDDNAKMIGLVGWLLVIFPIILIQFFFVRLRQQPNQYLIPLMITLLVGVLLLIHVKNKLGRIKERKAQRKKTRKALKELNQIEFNRLKPIHEKLYFCNRDRVVFLPGLGDYAKVDEMRPYLRKHA